MEDKVYINELGKTIRLDVGENVSAATAQSVSVMKPDATVDTWDAVVSDDNYIEHVTITGDVNLAGIYRVQAVVTVGGIERRGNTARFVIYPLFG